MARKKTPRRSKSKPRRKKAGRRARRTEAEMLASLERRVKELRDRVAGRNRRAALAERKKAEPSGPRFSAKWLATHRDKLEISAADYGELVGVTGQTIYNWEQGRARPQRRQLEALADVRGLKKREAWKKLGYA